LQIAVGNVLVDRGGAVVPGGSPAMGLPAVQVDEAELVLRLAVTLLRRPPEPHRGVTQIADDALAARIHQTQLVLRFGVAGRRRLREVFECLGGSSASAGGTPGSDQSIGGAGGI